jgi:malonyl-CoA O-methyltransferase
MNEKTKSINPRMGYDLWSQRYDDYDNPLILLEEPIIRELIGPVMGLQIADIGCGTGRYSIRLAKEGGFVTGVDFSNGMLNVLRSKKISGSLRLIEHDLNQDLPLESNAFDLVISCLVIEHLPNIDRILGEMSRICKSGGNVIISDFHPEMIRRGYHARFRLAPEEQKFQIHGSYRTVSDYVMAAKRSKLDIEHISEYVVNEEVAKISRSAKKWLGEPMLLVLKLKKP